MNYKELYEKFVQIRNKIEEAFLLDELSRISIPERYEILINISLNGESDLRRKKREIDHLLDNEDIRDLMNMRFGEGDGINIYQSLSDICEESEALLKVIEENTEESGVVFASLVLNILSLARAGEATILLLKEMEEKLRDEED